MVRDSPSNNERQAAARYLEKEVRAYNNFRTIVKALLIVLILGVLLIFLGVICFPVKDALKGAQRLDNVLAASDDGASLALGMKDGSKRTILCSSDSGRHFEPVASWPLSGRDTVLEAFAMVQGAETILAVTEHKLFIVSAYGECNEVIDLDTLPGKRPGPWQLWTNPNSCLAYLFKKGETSLYEINCTELRIEPVKLPENQSIADMAMERTGNRIALALHDKWTAAYTFLAGQSVNALTRLRTEAWELLSETEGNCNLEYEGDRLWMYLLHKGSTDLFAFVIKKDSLLYMRPVGVSNIPPGNYLFHNGWFSITHNRISRLSAAFSPFAGEAIPGADSISSLGFTNGIPSHAIIKSNSTGTPGYYLSSRRQDRWNLNPVSINYSSGDVIGFEIVPVIIALCMACLALLAHFNRTARRKWERLQADEERINAGNTALSQKSERPIGLHDRDLLGFEQLENAIVSLVRNP